MFGAYSISVKRRHARYTLRRPHLPSVPVVESTRPLGYTSPISGHLRLPT